ncbi:hypothetical protein QMW88_03290 [Cronobacter dublinensis]|uniref:hypothetical protein n=1 Tax=Cronobacter dublinensis TaxID=413497 RepID=UPI0014305A30|nr:hypothetical protein [Cronobacter dublinensis]MDK1191927.1 hypothetical protein [Cronobacter dublinensis]MDK1200304.1 hypothetical protein [Cronobacter dublinensis]
MAWFNSAVFDYRGQFFSATTRSKTADKLNDYGQPVQSLYFIVLRFFHTFLCRLFLRRTALAQRAVVRFSLFISSGIHCTPVAI